ncbi:MAG TPA: helix-turn-helix domain-containing protein [Actinotalea sp.]|nr:helix-turn-helix domain-containing protein [Actinotalea sp.]
MLRSVAVLVLPGVAPFELGVACEVFGIDRSDTGGPVFDFGLVTPRPGRVDTKLGFGLVVDHGLAAAESADLVVVPAYGSDAEIGQDVLDLLRAAHDRGAWLLSVCSGAFALARAGLLDGRRATTHWMYTDQLAARFPSVTVDPDVLYVEDRRVITSAGTAAGVDACLHLVRRELGAAAASAIARRMVVPPHRDGGQTQFIDVPVPTAAGPLADVLQWASGRLDDDLSVGVLARHAHMSERTFARRFRAEVGATPAAWVARQRLARAQELLEGTDLPVEEVGRRAGFGGAPGLRHHFAAALGTSPQAYRRTFSGPRAGGG